GYEPVAGGARFTSVFYLLFEQGVGATLRHGDPVPVLILKGDRQSFQCTPGGNIAAHDAGPDDVHMFGRRTVASFLAKTLKSLLEAENPQQVSRRVRADQPVHQIRRL